MSTDAYRFSGNDAANYDQYLGPLIFEPSSKMMLTHLAALPAQDILEISCGTGRLTNHLRAHFPSAVKLTATDISPDMLDLAQKKLTGLPIHFQIADAQRLPFADQSFDLVVNQYGLMFLPDKQSGFNEAWRVLQPGGHFIFATWDRTENMAPFKLVIDDTIIPFFKGEDVSRFYTPFSLHDAAQLTTYLEQAGFKQPLVKSVKFTGHTETVKNFLEGLFLKHPLGREVKERTRSSYDQIALELEQRLIRQFGSGPFEFELSAWIGIGQK